MKTTAVMLLVAFLVAVSPADPPPAPRPTTGPTTAPVFSLKLMTRNFGPLGQLVAATAAADTGAAKHFIWFTSQTDDERARIVTDLDTWTVVIVEPASPDAGDLFRGEYTPWTLITPTGPGTAVGGINFQSGTRHVSKSTRPGDGLTDEVISSLAWTPGPLHQIALPDGIEATSVSFTLTMAVDGTDLRAIDPVAVGKMELDRTSEAMFALPPEVGDPLVLADHLTDKVFQSAQFFLSASGSGDSASYSFLFQGGVGHSDPKYGIEISVANIAGEKQGHWHHLIGFVRINTTEAGAASTEHDVAFDAVFKVDEHGLPKTIPITWSWPAGPEAALAAGAAGK